MRGQFAVFFLTLMLSIAAAGMIHAQSDVTNIEVPQVQTAGMPLAGTIDNHLIVYDGFTNPTVIDLPGIVRGYNWNAAANALAILVSAGAGSAGNGLEIWVSYLENGRTFRLDTGAVEGFTPIFDADGFVIYVGEGENRVLDPAVPYMASMMRIEAQDWATAEQIGAFELTLECDGGGGMGAAAQYERETGFLGSAMMLQDTPYGILHSRTCGGMGLALFNPETGDDVAVEGGESLIRAALSPDGETLYAIRWTFNPPQHDHALVRVNLADRTIDTIETANKPDQLAVAPDGMVIYSSRTARDDGGYSTAIHRLNPDTGEESTLLTSDEWFGVARLTAPETFYMLFSAIPNDGVDEPPAGVYLLNMEIDEPLQPIVMGLGLFSLTPMGNG